MAKICQLHSDLKYYLCMHPVDMHKQFQGLQGIVNEEFGRYLTQDEAFVFIGKTLKTAKILHRESNDLTMYVRRLPDGRFLVLSVVSITALATMITYFIKLSIWTRWILPMIQRKTKPKVLFSNGMDVIHVCQPTFTDVDELVRQSMAEEIKQHPRQ